MALHGATTRWAAVSQNQPVPQHLPLQIKSDQGISFDKKPEMKAKEIAGAFACQLLGDRIFLPACAGQRVGDSHTQHLHSGERMPAFSLSGLPRSQPPACTAPFPWQR